MTNAPVYINDCGIITPLGEGRDNVLTNLQSGYTGGVRQWDRDINHKPVYVGIIDAELPAVPPEFADMNCRNNQLLIAVANQIETTITTLLNRYDTHRIGVVIGTSTSGIREGEIALAYQAEHGDYPDWFHYRQQEIGTPALFLRRYLGLTGIAQTISTACSSSAKVFASAQRLIACDICDAVIVGGADSLCQLTVEGFSALESVSAERCNPMSVNRDGINIGEAAALFVLSRDESPIQLLGCGESSDAYHMSAPHPEGLGATQSMRMALDMADLEPDQIGYINLHGTATPKNDAMESLAVFDLFGDVPCSSTKPLTGHTLGAAGATEIGFCYLLLEKTGDVRLPPHIWDGQTDPNIPKLNLVSDQTLHVKPGTAMLSNSFAFGGNNASVILGRR